jgi:mRNA-degrading endonuclease RelE of RelBE toxin-antitoxin system
VRALEIILRKQPQKYIASATQNIQNKLFRSLDKISRLEGDIKKLKGYRNLYRFKIDHFRILFEVQKQEKCIVVTCIDVRTNIKY